MSFLFQCLMVYFIIMLPEVVSHQVLVLVPEGNYTLPVGHKGVCKKTEASGEYASKLYGT